MRISTHAPARGATEGAKAYYNVAIISTHAPTGGATNFRSLYETGNFISIHAPTGGATVVAVCMSMLWIYFNPRSHGGSDGVSDMREILFKAFQSTLPRGERPWSPGHHETAENFNPRSHGGSDSGRRLYVHVVDIFQSTLPRGERLMIFRICLKNISISIHAPTGGATADLSTESLNQY